MRKSQEIMKDAVDVGYWQLYRYNPELADRGENPFKLDSKEPSGDYQAFLENENRYRSLKKAQPELAEKLFKQTEKDSKFRYQTYKKLTE